ncbi:ribbon-helix-helix domain-containing protein [Nesterenkonia alba]|uniref:ribbon-helix-helix domain-containing protein n=1 Tax=Nesterenkonia alba TaxID=515814 RepID=UPI0012EB4E48|nr:ribbon-helix-helix protein, CopG family [Nesterenkonia alba]
MKHVTVALPDDVAKRLEEHVRSGEYTSSDELVVESLRDHLGELQVEEVSGLEHFIRSHVVPAAQRADEDPSRRRPLDGLVERFRQRRAAESS